MYLPYIEWRTLSFSPTDKHSGKFALRKYEEPSYPKNQKMCDPILVTVLKMRPHYSQSSCENATPSSGTFPLASYKEVPLPPALRCHCNAHCSPSPSNSDCLGLKSFRIICIAVLKLTINVRVSAAVRMAVSLTFCKDPWELSAK